MGKDRYMVSVAIQVARSRATRARSGPKVFLVLFFQKKNFFPTF
jgi:hypothetical protein